MGGQMITVYEDEYVAVDSPLGFMLNYWHGWWRLMWHWHDENKGIVLPDLRMAWKHRKYCEDSWDKIGFGLTVWRLSLCFSCSSMEQQHARHRKMFPDDIWPATVLDDVLDAETIGDP